MNYAEAAYFDGNHCHHVAAYKDAKWARDRRAAADRNFRGINRRKVGGTN